MPQPSLRSKYRLMREDFNSDVALIAAVSAVGAFTYGFDLNWWGAILAHPYFNEVFGSDPVTTASDVTNRLSANQLSLGSAVSSIGALLGYVIAPALSKSLGYRTAMVLAAVCVIVGSLIQITCDVGGEPRYWQIVGGKVVISVAVGMNSTNLPVYLNACAPPSLRGAMINVYTSVVALAAIVASGSILGLQNTTSHAVWLIPIGLQFVTPLITIATIFLIPETPQWLISKGRDHEANQIMQRLRPRVPASELETELSVISKLLDGEKRSRRNPLLACFRGSNLMRTLTVLGMMCFFQAQGLGFVLGYFSVLLVQLGIPNVFQILVIIYALLLIFSLVSMLYQDAAGRRTALLAGAFLMAICMFGFGSILSVYPTTYATAANAAVALIILWVVFFTITWYSLTWTVITEIPSIELRPISLTIANMGQGITALIVTFVTPYLQGVGYANLGPKICYIYGSFSVIALAFVYFMIPELRGRPAVEIDWLFANHVPIRQMKDYLVPPTEPIATPALAVSEELDEKPEIQVVEDNAPKVVAALPV